MCMTADTCNDNNKYASRGNVTPTHTHHLRENKKTSFSSELTLTTAASKCKMSFRSSCNKSKDVSLFSNMRTLGLCPFKSVSVWTPRA